MGVKLNWLQQGLGQWFVFWRTARAKLPMEYAPAICMRFNSIELYQTEKVEPNQPQHQ